MDGHTTLNRVLDIYQKAQLSGLNPVVAVVQTVGDWILGVQGQKVLSLVIKTAKRKGYSFKGTDEAEKQVIVCAFPMTRSESIIAVKKRSQGVALIRILGGLRKPIRTSRRLRACTPRVARTRRAGRARKAAASRTGPPGSSEDGDPEPGDAGPNSHKLEKIETANTRKRGSHV
jgi:hypothetical protein